MKHLPLFVLAAVLAVTVPATAQLQIEGSIGRHVRGAVTIGGHDHRHDDRGRDHRHDHRHGRRDDHHGRRHVEPVRRHHHHGRWETVHEQVLVPGYWREDHVPATYGWIHDSCGHRHWGVVSPAGCRRVWVPARWETRCRQVWVAC